MSENTILEINEIPSLTPTPIPVTSIKKETYKTPEPAPTPAPAPTPVPTPAPVPIKEETPSKPVPKRRIRPNRINETNKKEDESKILNDTVANNIQKLKIDKYLLQEDDDDIVHDKKVPLNYNVKKTLSLKFF